MTVWLYVSAPVKEASMLCVIFRTARTSLSLFASDPTQHQPYRSHFPLKRVALRALLVHEHHEGSSSSVVGSSA